MFSAAWNPQLSSFVSWRTQPRASVFNAFLLNLGSLSAYMSPPFGLIFRCLENIRRDRANVVISFPVMPTNRGIRTCWKCRSIVRSGPLGETTFSQIPDELGPSVDWLQQPKSSHLQIVGDSSRRQGLSETVINLFLASNRPNIHSTYRSACSSWVDWNVRQRQKP